MDERNWAFSPGTVWLIDYNLKRDKDESDRVTSNEEKVFHGINKKFIQVLNAHEYPGTYKHSALDFLDSLRKLLDSREPHEPDCSRGTGTRYECYGCKYVGYCERRFRVLACEDVE
jgi:hypothetical protein